jgi:hypothetical protein
VTRDEWIAKALADAPPLSAAQIAALRPVFAPVIAHMQAAPAVPAGAAAVTAPETKGRISERA